MLVLNEAGMAEKAAQPEESLQLIDARGVLDVAGLAAFAKHVNLAECGLSYAVVAIIGPQSSGKSTLLNHLFDTNFKEMDATSGRTQTTQGVWIARASGISPCTLVMDLEGTDGRERGEDDTAFEKQSALFALAVSDIVIINMWCHDLGREHAANKPILKLIFQVMMRLFTPRKTTLLFVIRDKTRTPMEVLEPMLRDDVQKIWDSTPKLQQDEGTKLNDYFNVQVTALSNYEDKLEAFIDQVEDLRMRFNNLLAPGGIAGDRSTVVPGSAFPVSTCSMWKTIKENKDLDLPTLKVMVATVRCEETANEKLTEFCENQEWIELNDNVESGVVCGFGKKLDVLLDKYMSEYDQDVLYFDQNVRMSKRDYLLQQVLKIVNHAHSNVLDHHRNLALRSFKQDIKDWADTPDGEGGFAAAIRQCTEAALSEFDKGAADAQVSFAQWDASRVREKLRRDIDSHAAVVRAEKITAVVSAAKKRLEDNVGEPTETLLKSAIPDAWPAIRNVLAHEVDAAQSSLLSVLSGYELDKSEEEFLLEDMAKYGRTIVENKAKRGASQALLHMKDRFTTRFNRQHWSDKDDVLALAREAHSVCLTVLAVLAAIQLQDGTSDHVLPALATLLTHSQDGTSSKSAGITSFFFAASSWKGISTEYTLLRPAQCKNIWRQFKVETDYVINQALTAQELSRQVKSRQESSSEGKWWPPSWQTLAALHLVRKLFFG